MREEMIDKLVGLYVKGAVYLKEEEVILIERISRVFRAQTYWDPRKDGFRKWLRGVSSEEMGVEFCEHEIMELFK